MHLDKYDKYEYIYSATFVAVQDTLGVFETAYLLTTPTNYDVKLSMQNVVSEF